jgi:DNA replication protein DnaD
MVDFVGEMSADVVIFAIDRAVDAGSLRWNYIRAILYNWRDAGVRTLADAQSECDAWESRRCAKPNRASPSGEQSWQPPVKLDPMAEYAKGAIARAAGVFS